MFDHSINDLALSINSNASVMQHSSATSVFIIGADRTLLLISGGGGRGQPIEGIGKNTKQIFLATVFILSSYSCVGLPYQACILLLFP